MSSNRSLKNQNIHAFCPTIKIEKIKSTKTQIVEEAIFKGYIFIQIAVDDSCWHKVRSTRGIRDWIRFAGKVAKIPGDLVLDLINTKILFLLEVYEKLFIYFLSFIKGSFFMSNIRYLCTLIFNRFAIVADLDNL